MSKINIYKCYKCGNFSLNKTGWMIYGNDHTKNLYICKDCLMKRKKERNKMEDKKTAVKNTLNKIVDAMNIISSDEYNFEEGQLYFISGPMAGYNNWNKEAFDQCEKKLRSDLKASYVYNPAERIKDKDRDFSYYMREPLRIINMYQYDWEPVIDAIILLPGWQKSLGSVTEALVAHEVGITLVEW